MTATNQDTSTGQAAASNAFLDRLKEMMGLDLRSLAFYRILLGLIVIIDLIYRAFSLRAHYTDAGVLPRKALYDLEWGSHVFSFHALGGSVFFEALLFLFAGWLAFAVIIGYRTRWAVIGLWIMTMSLHMRNPVILQGGDVWLRSMIFWSMFLPLNAAWSVDALMGRLKDTYNTHKHYFSIATLAFILQIVYVYAVSGYLKTGDMWTDGTAMSFVARSEQLTSYFGFILRDVPGLGSALTYFTIFIEKFAWIILFLPFAISKMRWLAIILFGSLHLGIIVFMTLGMFPWFALVIWAAMIPGATWNWLGERRSKKKNLQEAVLSYPSGQKDKYEQLALGLSPLNVKFEEKPSLEEDKLAWNGKVIQSEKAYRNLEERSANPLKPLFRIKVVDEFLAANRKVSRGVEESLIPILPTKYKKLAIQLIAGVFLVLVGLWNLAELKILKFPKTLRPVIMHARLDQHWNMFAPTAPVVDGWYSIPGQLSNGKTVDMLQGGQPLYEEKPEFYNSLPAPLFRWRKYIANISGRRYKPHMKEFGKYQCRQWNTTLENRGTDKELETFKFQFHKLRLKEENPKEDTVILWKQWCSEKYKNRFKEEEERKKGKESASKAAEEEVSIKTQTSLPPEATQKKLNEKSVSDKNQIQDQDQDNNNALENKTTKKKKRRKRKPKKAQE